MTTTKAKALLVTTTMILALNANAQYGVTDEADNQNTPEGWTAVQLPQLPEITSSNTIYITTYGASTDATDNTTAIQKALDDVPSTGGMVVVPAGEWLCGPIKVSSKTILHLADGATLKLLPYGTYPQKSVSSSGQIQYDNFIDCKSTNYDIVVEGESKTGSVIDGQGGEWWNHIKEDGNDVVDMKRGAVIRFSKGSRFLIKNLTVKDAPGVNITISQNGKASHGTIHDVIIREPSSGADDPSHNTDGITTWGPYVNVYNCDISNGDDNFVADSNSQYIHVWNCQFGEGHGASFGSYTESMHDIIYEDISFKGTDSGFRLKSQRGRSGDVYNITFRNCTMEDVDCPIAITAWYDGTPSSPAQATTADSTSTTPNFRDILLQNVTSVGTKYISDDRYSHPIYIYGLPESHVKNVTFDNVLVSAPKGMFLAYCDGINFTNNCKIINTKESSSLIDTQYEATISGDYNESSAEVYTLDATTGTSDRGATTFTFNNGLSITNNNNKGYDASGSNSTIKYSISTQYTINLPEGKCVKSVTFAGYDNYAGTDAYLSEVNGTAYSSTDYVFPQKVGSTTTETSHTIVLATPATGTLTFTPAGKQLCLSISLLCDDATSGITDASTEVAPTEVGTIYTLQGTPARNANRHGLYIQNGRKYVVK